MLGGTNVLAYAMDPAGGSLEANARLDTACTDQPIGGPFALAAEPAGIRTLLLHWGATGALQAITVPVP